MINAATEWDEVAGEVVLIARDSDVAEMYRMKLELDGYRVITVADVHQATHRPGWRPDLVLIDLDDAGRDRLIDLQRLRADPILGNVPVLLLSACSEEELRERGFALRPTDYVLRSTSRAWSVNTSAASPQSISSTFDSPFSRQ